MRLAVADAEPEESIPRLRAGELDVAVTFDYPGTVTPQERDLDHTLLLTEALYVAMPENHPLATRTKVDMKDLADEPWLSGSTPSSCSLILRSACLDAGFEPRIAFESDDYHVLQGFIAEGLGVTLLPDLALHALRSGVVVRPTDPQAPMRRVWVATRKTRSAATEAMRKALVEAGERCARGAEAKLEAVA